MKCLCTLIPGRQCDDEREFEFEEYFKVEDDVDVKYPDIEVQLSGEAGNAFAIIGRVSKELRRAGVSKEEIDQFYDEATNGDYNNVLQTAMKWVNVA